MHQNELGKELVMEATGPRFDEDRVEDPLEWMQRLPKEALRMAGFLGYANHHALLGGALPAARAMWQMHQTAAGSLSRLATGQSSWLEAMDDWSRRMQAGARMHAWICSAGRELFGSARFEGERELVHNEMLRLSYLPPSAPSRGIAVFHAGGGLPYSDRIFRMLPEANFYAPFLERGVGVYAMELRGDRTQIDYSGLTLERLIDTIRSMSDVASRHAGGRKLILEGYCGHGMQALAYAAAHPSDAASKFAAIATFVSPIDGRACRALSEYVTMTPQSLLQAELALFEACGGYVPGEGLGMGLDLALGTLFPKSPLGLFAAGFSQPAYADLPGIESLTAAQRRELAGAYWISYENSGRFPMPVDLVRYATALFTKGISKHGDIPYRYNGRQLSLRALADSTSLKVFGFYGGRDAMVDHRTAACLGTVFGERYQHVVHPHIGHISYVLSPECWDASHPKALKPNPIDVLLSCERDSEPGA